MNCAVLSVLILRILEIFHVPYYILYHHMQFLSMKLAAVNARLDFNIDDLFTKEVRAMQITELLHVVPPFLLTPLHKNTKSIRCVWMNLHDKLISNKSLFIGRIIKFTLTS